MVSKGHRMWQGLKADLILVLSSVIGLCYGGLALNSEVANQLAVLDSGVAMSNRLDVK